MVAGLLTGETGPAKQVIRRGYRDGLTAEEVRKVIPGHWNGLDRINREYLEFESAFARSRAPRLEGVLSRASRWKRPGIVFARAAVTGEVDPLSDADNRVFCGLPPLSDD